MSGKVLAELQDFQAWRSSSKRDDFSLLDYVGCIATVDHFFAFVELLNPTLLEHEGNWFIAQRFNEMLYDQWKSKLGQPREIQKVMNHLHISTLFQDQVVPDHVALAIADRIADTWTALFSSRGLVGKACGGSFEDAEVTLFAM